MPSEGKTMLSFNLARVAAASGQRVLLLDGDLRRPRIHKSLGIPNDMSLIEVLNGDVQLDEACHEDTNTGLLILTGKIIHANPLDLLNSDRMRAFITEVRG
ncbi:MAG: hypothetical protein HOM35_06945, partial [Rhodospirillaceae bacterium]|nr:hypothetical protein [Rhodospirillaceae bacterium]